MPKYTSFTSTNIIQFRNNIIDFSTPKIMGILNLSTNSFYDGGKYRSKKEILSQCQRMISEGAEIIDIGAHSSKPGSIPIDEAKERDVISVKLDFGNLNEIDLMVEKAVSEFSGIDILFNNRIAGKHASRGQARTIAFALKLSEAIFVENTTGSVPVIILDDILSELDPNRRMLILDMFKN